MQNKLSWKCTKRLLWLLIFMQLMAFITLTNCGGCGSGSKSNDGNGDDLSKYASLSWDAPITNADGTPLTDLAGYKIYYGISSGDYSVIINVGNVTAYRVRNLAPGTYYFAVTAYDKEGNESAYSNERIKIIE